MTMNKIVVSVVASLALTACMSMGTKFDMADVDALQPGISTQQDVIAKLGSPNYTSTLATGDTMLSWTYTHANGFAPAMSNSKSVMILFTKDGKMARVMNRSQLSMH